MNTTPGFFEELKRRNVFRVSVVYLIAAWLLAQVADLMLESFHAPEWVIQAILVVLIKILKQRRPEGLERRDEPIGKAGP